MPEVESGESGRAAEGELVVALAGNPNVGKTTLFNALTGLKQKVANYPGVTVEKKVGRCVLREKSGVGSQKSEECSIIDLPGTYSLASRSPDEHVARQVVLGQIAGTPQPDVVVVVADASNLERNLYLVTQVLELGRPVVVALSMVDVAESQGKRIEVEKLSLHLRAAVVRVHAHRSGGGAVDNGIAALKAEILKAGKRRRGVGPAEKGLELPLPDIMETHIERLQKILVDEKLCGTEQAHFDAHLMLSSGDDEADVPDARRDHPKVRAEIAAALAACETAGVDPIAAEVETHYAFITAIVHDCVREAAVGGEGGGGAQGNRFTRTDRIDRIVTHKVWGMLIFVGIMGLVFLSIFKFAQPVMDFLQFTLVAGLGGFIGNHMAEGPLRSLIVDGVFAGVGNVVVFVPQIALLFLFLAVLEDSGYMSRAAFLMDRLMSRVGLHGKSFIPLLSGYACAVPAIMGTRVIENRRDRLATILILPLMSCSARLPVYTLLISLFFGANAWLSALVMLCMYLLGTFSAFGLAWVFKRTLLKGPAPAFILEMPPYRMPQAKVVLTTVAQRCWAFLKRAGTVIFAFSVVMWAGTHYPKPAHFSRDYAAAINQEQTALATASATDADQIENRKSKIENLQNAEAQEILEHSAAGRVGHAIAPLFYPLGYDWKTSVGVAGAFFAREVIVSTMGIVYSVGNVEDSTEGLQKAMKADVWPAGTGRAGKPVWSPLVAISLMVFVVFCMQCLSTLAVAKREMGHWGWPVFMFFYMTGLAWVMAFGVYQVGSLMGF
ncbi:MAG TPA: ferrous iron transport protein B [Phycisphaerae bacterium]|nr:ferrous iron transport protein B [Phycisphaerae bacterium]